MSPVMIRQYTHIAGLVLLVYDQIITWDREVNYIWRSYDWVLKMMFCLSRYGALAFQIINLIVTHPHFLQQPTMNCYQWFHFQSYVIIVLFINLQIVLMLRVYALYDRSIKMACFLFSWFVFYTIMAGLSSRKVVPLMKFDSDCMLVDPPHAGAIMTFCALCIADQGILWGLTAYKYRDAIRLGLSRNPILQLVMRDTSWAFFAISCLLTATVPSSLFTTMVVPFHSIACSLLSVLTCRTMLNMRGLGNPNVPLSVDVTTIDLELTSLGQGE